jgi:hypothetical protein
LGAHGASITAVFWQGITLTLEVTAERLAAAAQVGVPAVCGAG